MFLAINPITWDNMRQIAAELPGRWVFRGQPAETWGLSTSLERALDPIAINDHREIVEKKEALLLREFKRRAHHYIPSPPRDDESLEWLALIQHHGGATRLLDFSHSFYVAAFFAVEATPSKYENSAIWAVSLDKVDNAITGKIDPQLIAGVGNNHNKRYVGLSQKLLQDGIDTNMVFGVEPERMNERLAVQQGIFLFPCNIGTSFEENLAGVFDGELEIFKNRPAFGYDSKVHTPEVLNALFEMTTVLKIIVPNYEKDKMLNDLWKMNVSSATLFPGIDGFTRSLKYHLL